jgi:hypothetical protein
MSTLLIPLVIAIITAIVTVLFTIHVKFATSKEEAIDGVKSMLFKGVSVFGVLFTVYALFESVTSEEEVTHKSVFLIVYYCISLVVFLMALISTKTLDLIFKLKVAHQEHLAITKEMLNSTDHMLSNIINAKDEQLDREGKHLEITQRLLNIREESIETSK